MNSHDPDSEPRPRETDDIAPTWTDDGVDERDLVASSLIDDLATPEERRRAGDDPEVRARVEFLRTAVAAVGAAVTPPTDASRDAVIGAAMAEFDPVRSGETPANVEPIRPVAGRHPGRLLLVAAAILAVLGLPALLVLAQRSNDPAPTDLAANSVPETRDAAVAGGVGPDGFASREADAGGSSPSTSAATPPRPMTADQADPITTAEFGVVDTPDELRSILVGFLSATETEMNADVPVTTTTEVSTDAGSTMSATSDRCEALARRTAADRGGDDGRPLLMATATYMDSPVDIRVYRTPTGFVVVVTDPDCQVTAAFEM